MPEHIRALIVILVLAGGTFVLLRRSVIGSTAASDYVRRRNLWLGLTILAFASHSFWLYAAVATIVLAIAQQRETNIQALFFALLFVIPPASAEISGFGLINYFFALNHLRLLSLALLLPAFIALRRQSGTLAFGRIWPDRLLLAYLLLIVALSLRDANLTDTARQAFYLFVDVFLPYYVASRGLRKLAQLRDAMQAFVIAAILIAVIAAFEFARHWLLYRGVLGAMGIDWGYSTYLGRAGTLRASASTGHSIALGFALAVSLGLCLAILPGLRSRLAKLILVAPLGIGLFASLSRGPWVGAAVIVIAFIATGRYAPRRLIMLALAGVVSLPLLAVLPGGQKFLDLLPFIGNVEKGNIDYRERLMDNSLIVIQRNPWFGSVDFLMAPEMQEMRQGQGIIDIVNTYLSIALSSGLVGVALFCGFFLSILVALRRTIRAKQTEDDARLCGRALLATVVGILLMIFIVSSITVIPIIYWSVAGLCVAFVQMAQNARRDTEAHASMS